MGVEAIHSGTAIDRILRSLLTLVLLAVFAGMFLYDGFVGYPRENAAELARTAGVPATPRPVINEKLTANEGKRLAAQLEEGAAVGLLTELLGDPAIERGRDRYFLGPGGYLQVSADGERVSAIEWRDGVYTESDLLWQVWIGYFLAGCTLLAAAQFVRVVTTRVSLTDAGLKVRGKALIPLRAITGLKINGRDDIDTGDAGAVEHAEIRYELDGRQGLIRLDSYVVKQLPEIVRTIASHRHAHGDPGDAANDVQATPAGRPC